MTNRRPLISGNWRQSRLGKHERTHSKELHYLVPKETLEEVDVSIHPPFTDLRSVQTVVESDDLEFYLGAQNCHWEEKGAFTGEVSPVFLEKLNVTYVVAGHSERRELFGETDEMVNKKVAAIQAHNMTPIMCVGETLDEREAGMTEAKVLGQLVAGLAGRTNEQIASLVVAYEPIWAIGTGKTATADDAQTVCAALRGKLREIADDETAESVRIQYGGSVKGGNAIELMSQPDIDGALVGGASLDPDEFASVIQFGT